MQREGMKLIGDKVEEMTGGQIIWETTRLLEYFSSTVQFF